MSDLYAGWGWPAAARKAHWFDTDSIASVCGKWLFSGERSADDGTMAPNHCRACWRVLDKRLEQATRVPAVRGH